MKKAIVIYATRFGNTEKIARALAQGMETQGVKVDCANVEEVDVDKLVEYDFLAIGGPTHMIGMSKEMKKFLKKLKAVNLRGKEGFSFDTRISSRLNTKSWFILENSAARRIEGKMKRMKIKIVKPRQSALVNGTEGPLEDGMEGRFKQIGIEIAELIQ